MKTMIERHKDICNTWPNYAYHIFGCGAIGSNIATILARQGAESFCLYDGDEVDEVNLGVSAYLKTQVGQAKVNALKDLIDAMVIPDNDRTDLDPNNAYDSGCHIVTYNQMFRKQIEISTAINNSLRVYRDGIVGNVYIMCYDEMEIRRKVLQEICMFIRPTDIVMDARMGAEQLQIYTWKVGDIGGANSLKKDYEKVWYPDSEGTNEPCTEKSTYYCVGVIGGFMTNVIRKILTGQPYEDIIYFHFTGMMLETRMIMPGKWEEKILDLTAIDSSTETASVSDKKKVKKAK